MAIGTLAVRIVSIKIWKCKERGYESCFTIIIDLGRLPANTGTDVLYLVLVSLFSPSSCMWSFNVYQVLQSDQTDYFGEPIFTLHFTVFSSKAKSHSTPLSDLRRRSWLLDIISPWWAVSFIPLSSLLVVCQKDILHWQKRYIIQRIQYPNVPSCYSKIVFFGHFIAWIHIVKSSRQRELPALPLKFEPGIDSTKTIPSSVRPFNLLYCRFVNTSRLRLEFWRCRIPCGKDIKANLGAIQVCDILALPLYIYWFIINSKDHTFDLLGMKTSLFSTPDLKERAIDLFYRDTNGTLHLPEIIKSRSLNKDPTKSLQKKKKKLFSMLVRLGRAIWSDPSLCFSLCSSRRSRVILLYDGLPQALPSFDVDP